MLEVHEKFLVEEFFADILQRELSRRTSIYAPTTTGSKRTSGLTTPTIFLSREQSNEPLVVQIRRESQRKINLHTKTKPKTKK